MAWMRGCFPTAAWMVPVVDPEPQVWGCVLIGGRSLRMGEPKHLLLRDGRTWVERTVALLRRVTSQVVIVGAGVLPDSLAELPRVADAWDAVGPLAGLLGAVRAYPSVSWLVAACDMPDIEEQALLWLLNQRRPGVRAVLPSLSGDDLVEPLLAYYDQTCRSALEDMAARGERRIGRLRLADGVETPCPPQRLHGSWHNINRPEDLSTTDRRGVLSTKNPQ